MIIILLSVAILIIILFLFNIISTNIKVRKFYKGNNGMLFKTINNIEIAYIKKGHGFPLLLIHGFMASSLCYMDIFEELAKNNLVYAVDVPGFGFSDKGLEQDYKRSGMAKNIYEFMKSEGIESFNLLGHSMGGEISIHMALSHPESINKLILVSSAGCQDIKVMPRCIVRIPFLCNFLIKNIFMTYYFQKIIFEATVIDRKSYNKSIFDDIFSVSKVNIPSEVLRRHTERADDCNVMPKLRFIKNEVLIIWGEGDNVVPVRIAYKIHELIKGSKLEIIENCRHNPYIERPQEFLDILSRFL